MLSPNIKNCLFRPRPAWRADARLQLISSPLLGTNGILATANLRVLIPKGRNKLIVGDASLIVQVAATATTYTAQVGKRTAAGVDVPLTIAHSVQAAGVTAMGGVNRTNPMTQTATVTDSDRIVMPDDILYVDLVVSTLTVQPTATVTVNVFVVE